MRISLVIAAVVAATAFIDLDSRAAGSTAPQLTVMRAGERPTIPGPAANFTGKAVIDRQVRPDDSARIMGSLVSFDPGARTAWHTHPLGQTLIVTSGCGWVQTEGGKMQEILPGDVVWTPAGVRHWHGAQAHSAMSHYAIVEPLNGKNVEWMEHVTDAQYGSEHSRSCKKPPAAAAS
jgi:quercetin dioxygenase-like cupin family protein